MALSSVSSDLDDLHYFLYQPEIQTTPESFPANTFGVRLYLTVNFKLHRLRHNILTGDFIGACPLTYRRSQFFNESSLSYLRLGSFFNDVGIPECDASAICIDEIIQYAENWNSRSNIYILRVDFSGEIVENVISESESEFGTLFIDRVMEESEVELETRDYGMVTANSSTVNKLLKKDRLENCDEDLEKDGKRKSC